MFLKCLTALLFVLPAASATPLSHCSGLDRSELQGLSDGCHYWQLTLSAFHYEELGIGLGAWDDIDFNQRFLRISGGAIGDPSEGSGFRQSFTIEGLTRPFMRTLQATGSCSVDEDVENPSRPFPVYVYLNGKKFSSDCRSIEEKTFILTEFMTPEDPHYEHFDLVAYFSGEISGRINAEATYEFIPEPSTLLLLISGFGVFASARAIRTSARSLRSSQ